MRILTNANHVQLLGNVSPYWLIIYQAWPRHANQSSESNDIGCNVVRDEFGQIIHEWGTVFVRQTFVDDFFFPLREGPFLRRG